MTVEKKKETYLNFPDKNPPSPCKELTIRRKSTKEAFLE